MFQIAIPSYNRAEILTTQTLSFLRQTTINLNNITIFVANEEQYELYKSIIPDVKLVVAELGVRAVRNFITRYYPEGEKVLSMDDDIQGIWELKGDLYELWNPKDFEAKVMKMFIDCEIHQRRMFGIYPTKCKMYQKESAELSTNMKFCIGHFFGVINRHIFTDIDYKEDYQRSIEYSLRDGGVLRYNRLCAYTKFGIGGGVNKTAKERHDTYEKEIVFLLSKYPNLINRNKRRACEIILTTSVKKFNQQRAVFLSSLA